MDKQIKFRGLRVDGKGWVYGFYVLTSNKYHQILTGKWDRRCGCHYSYQVIPETVGQLHNELSKKAGREVYVGDKISFRLAEGLGFPESDDREGIVKTIEDHYGYYKNVKVIGSIHEESEVSN